MKNWKTGPGGKKWIFSECKAFFWTENMYRAGIKDLTQSSIWIFSKLDETLTQKIQKKMTSLENLLIKESQTHKAKILIFVE